MGLPLNKLIGLGTTAAVIAVGGSLFGDQATALTSVVSSALINLFSTLAQPAVEEPPETPESLIRNHDLRLLVGLAIRDTILLERIDPKRAKRLADGANELWMSDFSAGDTTLAPLNEEGASKYFDTDAINFDGLTALDEPTWNSFLTTLAASTDTELPEFDPLRDRLKAALFRHLPQMLRAKVKQDFDGKTEAGGRGFASLQLVMMGRLMMCVNELLNRPRDSHERETLLLEELRRFNANTPHVVKRHDKRITDPRERKVMSSVLEQINQLRPYLDRRFDEMLRAQAAGVQQIKEAVKTEGKRTSWIIAGVSALAIIVVFGIGLLISGQHSLSARLDDVVMQKSIAQATNPNAQWNPSPDDLVLFAEIKKAGSLSERATVAWLEGRIDDGHELLGQVNQQAITDAPYRYYMAKAQLDSSSGNSDSAARFYEKALSLRERDINATLGLINLLSQTTAGDIRADRARAVKLARDALNAVPPKSDAWAALQATIAYSLWSSPDRMNGNTLPMALAAADEAVKVFSKDHLPREWAAVRNTQGLCWHDLKQGNQLQNLLNAIAAYNDALTVFEISAINEPWNLAITLQNHANSLRKLRQIDANAVEKAIQDYLRAEEILERLLKTETRPIKRRFLIELARVRHNHGNALQELPYQSTEKRVEVLKRSEAYYKQALETRTRSANPFDWADTTANLAGVYRELCFYRGGSYFDQSLQMFSEVEEVFTRDAYPYDWARTCVNKGMLYYSYRPDGTTPYMSQAVRCLRECLVVTTREADPSGWALVQWNIGYAFFERKDGIRRENLLQGLDAFKLASLEIKKENSPKDWVKLRLTVGEICIELANSDRENRVKWSIEAIRSLKAGLAADVGYLSGEQLAAGRNGFENDIKPKYEAIRSSTDPSFDSIEPWN